MTIELYQHQVEAVEKMHNGCILCGGVGTGKSRTSLVYYYSKVCGAKLPINVDGSLGAMATPRDLYIITTAKKRDSGEWLSECSPFCICSDEKLNPSGVKVVIDSWNNVKKYKNVFGAFFIFDEQRVVGRGAWVKAFLDISRKNQWILLSATPGDTWSDYVPVFIANGFFKSRYQFEKSHVVYNPYCTKFKMIDHYVNTGYLVKCRSRVLVLMRYDKETIPHHINVPVTYDRHLYSMVAKDRWNVYDNEPIAEVSTLFYLMRRVVNSDQSRIDAVEALTVKHERLIIFYNFTYELAALRNLYTYLDIPWGEWNGEVHSEIPKTERWGYFVQYTAGSEGWNCIETNALIFYSQSYSYKATVQAAGRIDRLNTPYTDLFYYHLRSTAPIDIAIARALSQKKNFQEKSFMKF